MSKLETPDLCARIDALKKLCARLEEAQKDPQLYRDLVLRIRTEAEMLELEIPRVS